jgi:hypothetical protein
VLFYFREEATHQTSMAFLSAVFILMGSRPWPAMKLAAPSTAPASAANADALV